jgi:hypothetical protein
LKKVATPHRALREAAVRLLNAAPAKIRAQCIQAARHSRSCGASVDVMDLLIPHEVRSHKYVTVASAWRLRGGRAV